MSHYLVSSFPSSLSLTVRVERWPIREPFTIARGTKTEAVVVVAEVSDGTYKGLGECVPYARYGESPEGVQASLFSTSEKLKEGMTRRELQKLLPAGAARNALDCALWDYEAKASGIPVAERLGIVVQPVEIAYTITLGTPEAMGAKALKATEKHALLKIKLGGGTEEDVKRLGAVRRGAPNARLIVDANEGWSPEHLAVLMFACKEMDVLLVEQPLPEGKDDELTDLSYRVPVCADESARTSADIPKLAGRYDAVNIKLDKAGGLTEALLMREAARKAGMKVIVGCMVSTSLSIAPAMLLTPGADFVDLDGALLLTKDRGNVHWGMAV
jgi:L-alanine-DL-glutamate epimerase-like enolase superfamily enzyme